MTSPQAGRDRHRHGAPESARRQVVDVVVLGDHEALPGPLRRAIESAVELQDDGSPVGVDLVGVPVGNIDDPHRPLGREMAELPTVRPRREIPDDVERLSGLQQRILQREVVRRGHDELRSRAALSQEPRQAREEPVDLGGFEGGGE